MDRDASGENTGLSWADAFIDLQSALAVAVAGEEIWVAEGTYRPTAGGNRALSFQLKSGVAIYGGFAAIETERTQRNPLAHVTILSGDLLGNDAPGFANYDDNSLHVVVASGVNLTAVLDGFTIRGGNANGSGFHANGGGALFLFASPTLRNCVVEANQAITAAGVGGGLASVRGAALILDSILRQNRAFRGGGAFLGGAELLAGCTVQANFAFGGGGVLLAGRATLEGCSLVGNIAQAFGGAGMLCVGDARVVDTSFSSNSFASYGRGGAALVTSARASFERCFFQANSAPHSGGGLCIEPTGRVSVDSCSFLGNSTPGPGGAILASWSLGASALGELRILACDFRDNVAARGGALYFSNVKPVVVSSKLWRNRAFSQGGAVMVTGLNEALFRNCSIALNSAGYRGGGLLTLDPNARASNCILWGNTAPFGSQLVDSTGLATIARCQVQFGWPGLNSALDPLFVSLASGDLRLQSGSPCIDSGNNIVVPSWAGSDFDHRPRFHDDPATVDTGAGTAPIVDRGAHEYGSPTVCPADCDGDGQCDAFEISSGADTDLNANEIPDGCDGKALEPALGSGQSVTLLPDGGAGNPTLEPVVELENQFGPGGASIAVVQSERDLHPGAGGYGTLGKTVTVETSLLDGEFWMRVSIPFSIYDLAGLSWSSIDLLYFDVDAQQWELAASANTVASPGHSGPVGDRFALAGTTLPVLSSELGDHGVFWDPVARTGFAWANVDHTTDFSGGFAFGAFPDCNGNGSDDLLDLQAGGVDCNGNTLLDVCELALGLATDCDANGIPDFCDIVAGRQKDCNGNGVPDACDLASGTSLDVFPSGGDGIPDDCQLGFKRLGASAPGFGGSFPR